MQHNQSLPSQLHQLLSESNSDSNKNKPIETPLLKVLNNTIVFDNTVYQIRNISTVALADLTKTYAINTSVPSWYWFLLVLGFCLIFAFIGILILMFVAWLFWQHRNLEKSRTVKRYGLRISMNSQEEVILTSNSKDFVLAIVLTLNRIMNTEETKALQFNFETLTIERIEDRSISIERTYGSTINSGQIAGDAVNNI
ncbi:MAG: DUF6232 family protein [Microcoleus sp.]